MGDSVIIPAGLSLKAKRRKKSFKSVISDPIHGNFLNIFIDSNWNVRQDVTVFMYTHFNRLLLYEGGKKGFYMFKKNPEIWGNEPEGKNPPKGHHSHLEASNRKSKDIKSVATLFK